MHVLEKNTGSQASLDVDMQASSSSDPILLAQKSGRVGVTKELIEGVNDLAGEALEMAQGLRNMSRLDIIRQRTEMLELQIPPGTTQRGHILFDSVTGKYKGSVIGPIYHDPSQTTDVEVIIHGREARPLLK